MTNLELKGQNGGYRVIGVDTFDKTDWVIGDYMDKEEALAMARMKGGEMLKTHVYDSEGNHIADYGTF